MCVKLVHVHQPPDLEYERNKPPYVERGKEKEEEEGKSGEPTGASVGRLEALFHYTHLETHLSTTTSDNRVICSGRIREYSTHPKKERGKTNDESYCATRDA
jgi:hypothetical protein